MLSLLHMVEAVSEDDEEDSLEEGLFSCCAPLRWTHREEARHPIRFRNGAGGEGHWETVSRPKPIGVPVPWKEGRA